MKSSITSFERIVFYDGDCGFCSAAIQFILKNRKHSFYFIALQSTEATKFLSTFHTQIDMNSLFYYEKGKLFNRSTAILKICRHLKTRYLLLSYLGWIFPRLIRDSFYNLIARKRLQLKSPSCIIPTENERKYFLDRK
ncbi:MAG: DUF393 domain-containing protein [Brumimicrobium sp.]|nr:DUF393 domain-containing protein [Brumimicrobium sp.]